MQLRHLLAAAVVALVCGDAPGAEPAPPPRAVVRFVARIDSTDAGAIAQLTLSGDGIARPLDLKADVAAFEKALKKLAAEHKGKAHSLTLEIDRKLLQAFVVQLVDASIRAGFDDVSPVPLDPKDR